MSTKYLSDRDVEEFVIHNRYSLSGDEFEARCFSSDYPNIPTTPGLAIPGGDVGELAILLAAANSHGFNVNLSKAIEALFKLTGQNKQLHMESANHKLNRCMHTKYMLENAASYNLNPTDIDALKHTMSKWDKNYIEIDFSYSFSERAAIIFEATKSLYPQYLFKTQYWQSHVGVFILHKSCVDKRHKLFSEMLVQEKAVELSNGLDSDYVYDALSENTDIHFFETLRRIDPQLPIFYAKEIALDSFQIESYS